MTDAEPRASQPEWINDCMWAGFIRWALGEPKVRAQFEAATGKSLEPSTSPIDRLIDESTGYRDAALKAFVIWATREMWGVDYAPAALKAEMQNIPEDSDRPAP